ncbi:MAG: ABC transporter substrate-binding protein [Chloroflexi bacterium]|nr:ABC transporter substrate-binding protein [Chloroflexota bacterium]
MKSLLHLLSLLMVMGLVLSGCAPSAPGAPPAKDAAKAPAAAPAAAPTASSPATPKPGAPAPTPKPSGEEPRSGGILTIAHMSNPVDLDPLENTSISTLSLNGPVYSQLFQFDPFDNDKVIADLAEKWEFSADGKVATLFLRKGAKWHDGQPFTADDVKFSLEFMTDPKNPKVNRKLLNLIAIDKVEVVDPTTAKLMLKAPSASLLVQLALPHSAIGPKHIAQKAAKPDAALDWTIVGTGPMKYKEYVNNSFYSVVKNPDYFIKGRPYLDGIRYYIVADPATRLAGFRTGQIMLTAPNIGLAPSHAKIAEREIKGVQIVQHPRGVFNAFFMNPDRKPWGDSKVRRAVSLGTDRQAAIDALGEGIGSFGTPVTPGEWSLSEDEIIKTPGYRMPKDADRAEAKKLLAEAGFPQGFKTSILVRNWSEYVRIAEFMKDQLSRIGIDAAIDPVEQNIERVRRFGAKPDWDTLVATAAIDNNDPAGANKYFLKGNDFNFFDEEIDRLWQEQDTILEFAERRKLVLEVQRRFLEISPYVVLFWTKNITGIWPQVKNFKPGNGQYTNLRHENTWLAK